MGAARGGRFDITSALSLRINAWTAREAGDRLINEHDEADTEDQQEELYFVQDGRARFELTASRVAPPAPSSTCSPG